MDNTVYDTILSRRSIRSYTGAPVEDDKIIMLLKAAMAAPSACNLQPWEFIVVTDREVLDKIEDLGNKYNAPLMIVACGSNKNIPWGGEGWMLDCGAAIQNMMVAGIGMGLGSLWVGGNDPVKLKEILSIPEYLNLAGIIYFGYTEEEAVYGTHYKEDAVHWQKFDNTKKRVMRTMSMLETDLIDLVK